jgi:hypothetical protein
MTDNENGPPDEERPPKGPINSLGSHHTTPAGIEYSRGIRRRRAASWRIPGGDPWRYEPPVGGYEEAAMHLLELGLTPGLCLPAMRQMWRDSPESRRVVRIISERWAA